MRSGGRVNVIINNLPCVIRALQLWPPRSTTPSPPPLQPHSTPSLIPALWLVHHHHLTPPAPSPLPLSSRVWVPCLILFGFIFWFVSFLFVSQSNSDCDRQGWSVRWLGLSVSLHSVDRCHRFPQRSLRFRHGTGWLIYFFLLWSCLEPDVIVSVWARPFPSTSCFSRKIRSSKTRQVDRRPRVLYFCFFPVSFLLSFFKKNDSFPFKLKVGSIR